MATGALKLLEQDEARSQRVAASYLVSDNSAPWESILGGAQTASGVTVTPETAERVSAVYACINVIAADIGTLPLHLYRRKPDGSRERATDHPLYPVLHDVFNPIMTSTEAREMMQGYLSSQGNAYAVIDRDGAGRITQIIPVRNDRVQVFKYKGALYYQVYIEGETLTLDGTQCLHLKGRSRDGVLGLSTIGLAREAIGLAMVTEKHGASFFENGARPSGVLQAQKELKPEQVRALKAAWKEHHAGSSKMQEIGVTWGGVTYTPYSISNEDAQFLETRQWQVEEIARLFRVPPHKIGHLERSTNNNIEHQGIEYVVDCIRPICVRWEQRLNSVLLTPSERREYFCEFSLDGLMRGDMKSRYESYAIGRNGGWLCPDEIRDFENMNRIGADKGGDTYMQPLNMGKLGSFPQSNQQQGGNSNA